MAEDSFSCNQEYKVCVSPLLPATGFASVWCRQTFPEYSYLRLTNSDGVATLATWDLIRSFMLRALQADSYH